LLETFGGVVLVIRKEQLAAFQREKDEAFAAWTVEWLRRGEAPCVAGVTDGVARRRVLAAMARARGLGLTAPMLLLRYAKRMLEYGPRFDTHPSVRALLLDTARAPEARLDALDRLPASVWTEISQGHEPGHWQEPDVPHA
jgi:hypothetical protein